MIKAAIFDMNGVLVDDVQVHTEGWKSVFLKRNLEFDSESFRKKYAHMSSKRTVQILFKNESEEEKRSMLREKKEAYLARLDSEIKLVPGVLNFIKELREAGFKLAIATSGQETVLQVITRFHLLESFDAIVSENDVKNTKPDPEIYLKAAEKLGIKPNECVAFEDLPHGVESALKAGMKCVGVATTQKVLKGCEFMINDFTEVSVEQLRGL